MCPFSNLMIAIFRNRRAPTRALALPFTPIFVFFICLFFVPSVAAQYRVDSWNADNGLPQNPVNNCLQTRNGFIWLATFAGLVRYDGAVFQTFNTVNTSGIKSSRFVGLFEDNEGNLWAPTEGQGLTRYDNRAFTTFTTENGLPDNQVSSIFYDNLGTLVFDTPKGVVQWKNNQIEPYSGYVPSESQGDKRIVFRDRSNLTWYMGNDRVLYKFENGSVVKKLPVDFYVVRVYEDRASRLWIEIDENSVRKLVIYADGKFSFYKENNTIPRFHWVALIENDDGMWFAMPGKGLGRYQNDKFTYYTTSDGLLSNDVNGVFRDREGLLWVASSGGLNRLTERVLSAYSSQNGLTGDNIYPIYKDHQGNILIGAWTGLTSYKDGKFTNIGHQLGIDTHNLLSIAEDKSGALWLGFWGSPPRRIKDGVTTVFSQTPSALTVNRSIYQDRNDDIWFGTIDGLFKFHNGIFEAQSRAAGRQFYCIKEDRQGSLWIGTDVGLTKYRDGVFTNYGEKDGLDGNFVRSIYEDASGTMWFGTYDRGLFRLKDGKFTHYTTKDGLFDNGAFQILEDSQGIFWMSCNLGIYRVSKKDLDDFAEGKITSVSSVPYNKRDGMLNSECNGGGQPAGVIADDGLLWFPSQKGVVVVDPKAIPINRQPPAMAITDLIIDRQSSSLRDSVEIQPQQTEFEIHYAGLTFIRPELTRFRYKLENLDDDWQDVGNRRFAYYTHVPYGKYVFRVKAVNRDGVWSEQDASIIITVVPPFWRTWWFFTLIIMAVVGLAVAFFRWRVNQLRKEKTVQEAFSRQLIESQESERKRIAAGLHDSLTQSLIVIKNWALMGISSVPENEVAQKRLTEISTTASLALNEVREIAYNLSPYQLDRLGLTQTILEMVDRVGDSSGIHFYTDVSTIDGLLPKEAEINLFRIIQESVNNIVKHSGATEATLIIKVESESMFIKIYDNGKGFIRESDFPTNPGRPGFGLLGMSERIRMLGGTSHIDSEPGSGTNLDIRLPLDNAIVK